MFEIPKITANIEQKTPVWTGSINDNLMVRIEETGILGSIRWLYEAVMRGFDSEVCDPASSKCNYDEKQADKTGIATDGFYDDKGKISVCPACQIFGCTGWSKQFRMQCAQKGNFKFSKSGYNHDNHAPRKNGYYSLCNNTENKGTFTLEFYPRNKNVGEILTYLISLINKWGGLGARPQMGHGIVDIDINSPYKTNLLQSSHHKITQNFLNGIPVLKDFFFCKLEVNNTSYPVKHQLIEAKYQLRQAFHNSQYSRNIRHFICGEVGVDKKSSKIFISYPFVDSNGKNIMLIRGYIPQNPRMSGYDQQKIMELIYDAIKIRIGGNIIEWTDYLNTKQNYTNWLTTLI